MIIRTFPQGELMRTFQNLKEETFYNPTTKNWPVLILLRVTPFLQLYWLDYFICHYHIPKMLNQIPVRPIPIAILIMLVNSWREFEFKESSLSFCFAGLKQLSNSQKCQWNKLSWQDYFSREEILLIYKFSLKITICQIDFKKSQIFTDLLFLLIWWEFNSWLTFSLFSFCFVCLLLVFCFLKFSNLCKFRLKIVTVQYRRVLVKFQKS